MEIPVYGRARHRPFRPDTKEPDRWKTEAFLYDHQGVVSSEALYFICTILHAQLKVLKVFKKLDDVVKVICAACIEVTKLASVYETACDYVWDVPSTTAVTTLGLHTKNKSNRKFYC